MNKREQGEGEEGEQEHCYRPGTKIFLGIIFIFRQGYGPRFLQVHYKGVSRAEILPLVLSKKLTTF